MEIKIIKILRKNNRTGLSIAELARELKSSRFIVRNVLLQLEALNKVYFKKVATGKFYFLMDGKWIWKI